MKAEEAKILADAQKEVLIQEQIRWVHSNIRWAIEKGNKSCQRQEETLYNETIEHFIKLGYKAKNGFSSPGITSMIHITNMDDCFSYWEISWED